MLSRLKSAITREALIHAARFGLSVGAPYLLKVIDRSPSFVRLQAYGDPGQHACLRCGMDVCRNRNSFRQWSMTIGRPLPFCSVLDVYLCGDCALELGWGDR